VTTGEVLLRQTGQRIERLGSTTLMFRMAVNQKLWAFQSAMLVCCGT
jgi:hypothetical protein